jgi:hypothetical protein
MDDGPNAYSISLLACCLMCLMDKYVMYVCLMDKYVMYVCLMDKYVM